MSKEKRRSYATGAVAVVAAVGLVIWCSLLLWEDRSRDYAELENLKSQVSSWAQRNEMLQSKLKSLQDSQSASTDHPQYPTSSDEQLANLQQTLRAYLLKQGAELLSMEAGKQPSDSLVRLFVSFHTSISESELERLVSFIESTSPRLIFQSLEIRTRTHPGKAGSLDVTGTVVRFEASAT